MTTPEIALILTALGVGGLISTIYTKISGKRKENADIDNLWKTGRELDMKFSKYIDDLVEKKANEKTQDLRNAIADSEVAHHKEKEQQGKIFAAKFTQLEESATRRERVLEMKIERMQTNFDDQFRSMEKRLNEEIEIRNKCLQQLGELQKLINNPKK